MRPVHNQRFCRVDKQTLEVVEGPVPLPQNWGNVTGFNRLQAKDVKKWGWYPLADYSAVSPEETDFSLVFLPEKELVVKVHSQSGGKGLKDHAIAVLLARTKYAIGGTQLRSTALGPVMEFPNDPEENSYRLFCLLLGADYECIAKDADGNHQFVVVPHAKLDGLVRDIHSQSQQMRQKLRKGFEVIEKETPAGLRALLDTDLEELYAD